MAMLSPEYGLRRTLTDALEDELYHISSKFHPNEDFTLGTTTPGSLQRDSTLLHTLDKGAAVGSASNSAGLLITEPWQDFDLSSALNDLERQFGTPVSNLAAKDDTLAMDSYSPRVLPATPQLQSFVQPNVSSSSTSSTSSTSTPSVKPNIFNKFSDTALNAVDAATASPPKHTVNMRNLISPKSNASVASQFNNLVSCDTYLPVNMRMDFVNPTSMGNASTAYTHDGLYYFDSGFDETKEFEFPLLDRPSGLNNEDVKTLFCGESQDDDDDSKVFGAVDMDLDAFNNLYSEDQIYSNSLGSISTLSSRSSSRSTFSELSGDCPSELTNVSHSIPASSFNTLSSLEACYKKSRDAASSSNVTKRMNSKNGRKRNNRGKLNDHMSHASAEMLKSMLGQVRGIQKANDSMGTDSMVAAAEHGSLVDDDDIYTCRLVNLTTGQPCLAQFSRSYDLTRHQNTVHAKKKLVFRCSECIKKLGLEGYDRTFSRLDALTRHCKTKHEHLTLEERQRVTKFAKENIGYVVD